jgi:hypothetical protein
LFKSLTTSQTSFTALKLVSKDIGDGLLELPKVVTSEDDLDAIVEHVRNNVYPVQ